MLGKAYSNKSKQILADKIMEWGNLVFVALVLTQFIPGPISNPAILLFGISAFSVAYAYAINLIEGGESSE